MPEIKSALILR
ncbi:unnamed protein product [Allacma fusca]|uniref:Uncharacterized protein n=1 Tax=Allacma fusca TaxID=39272 RepID=A0A8J2K925_9HEXA|nr:unnamed protein product [Allacma fusca]